MCWNISSNGIRLRQIFMGPIRLRAHYDHVRPHEGLGRMTPGEASSMTLDGRKWLALMQCASLPQRTG